MKLSSDEQVQAHSAASRRGAIEGTAVSSAFALGASYYLHRTSATYRQLPISLKALGIVLVVAPCLSIQAERRGLEYDKSQWVGEGVRLLDGRKVADDARWEQLTMKDKIGDWAERHQYSIILGGWASSLAVAGTIISRDKIQTTAQKVVQVRMWAQGLTIGLIIVAGALTHAKRAEAMSHVNADHSWRDLLEQQERDKEEARRLLKQEATPPTRRETLNPSV